MLPMEEQNLLKVAFASLVAVRLNAIANEWIELSNIRKFRILLKMQITWKKK